MGVARFQGVKVGTIVPMGYLLGVGERGYLPCDGTTRNIVDFPRLAAKLGTTWGGDGVTTFGLPESRGEALRGLDQGRGVDAGRVLGTAQAGQMPSHTHTETMITTAAVGPVVFTCPGGTDKFMETKQTGAAGGTDNASENRMRNIAVPFYIKT